MFALEIKPSLKFGLEIKYIHYFQASVSL